MKDIKLYNVIFPIWLLLFFPPFILITLFGNYLIDSFVIIVCFYMFRLSSIHKNLQTFYKKSIIKVWLYGFLADIIGALILFLFGMFGTDLGMSYELTSAISYDPFSHPLAVVIILTSMLVASYFIFIFNYKITLISVIEEKSLRFKVALAIAIITTPWTFIVPTKWFY